MKPDKTDLYNVTCGRKFAYPSDIIAAEWNNYANGG